jgi:hypothetical protein
MDGERGAPGLFSIGSPAAWCSLLFKVLVLVVVLDVIAFIGCPTGTYPSEGKVVVRSIFEWSGYIGLVAFIPSIGLLFARAADPRMRIANPLLSLVAAAASTILVA